MTARLLLISVLATCTSAADATIYRCAEASAKAPAYFRLEDGHAALTEDPSRDGWADLCTRPNATCKTDKQGRFHADFFTVDAGENFLFDPGRLQLMHLRSSTLYGGTTERTTYGCKPLPPGEEAALVKPWRPASP